MPFDEYKKHLAAQKKWLKKYLKGRVYFVSWYKKPVRNPLYNIDDSYTLIKTNPFVGHVRTHLKKPV